MIVQAPVARLLRLIIEKQSTAFLLTQGIQEDDFAHKDAKAAFSWLKSFNDRWGKFPDVETVEQEIGLKLPKIVEDEDFTLVSFKKYAQSKKIERLMTDASLRLEAKDVEGAASILGQIANLKLATAAGHSFRGTAYERYDRYESGKASIGSGLSTPWPRLTDPVCQCQIWLSVLPSLSGRSNGASASKALCGSMSGFIDSYSIEFSRACTASAAI